MAATHSVVLTSICAYLLLLLGIGIWVSRHNQSSSDFFLGDRRLGPWVTGISYSASASSAWTLLGVSGAAFSLGPAVIWVALGSFSGMIVAWRWVSRPLLDASHRHQLVTFSDYLTHGIPDRDRRQLTRSIGAIILIAFVFYIAAQFQGAGLAFSNTFALDSQWAIVAGAVIILVYTWLGGYWAVSLTDAIQGLVMGAAALALPVATWLEFGSDPALRAQLVPSISGITQTLGEGFTLAGLGFALGSLGISLGTFGQPHLMVRFMSLRDNEARRRAGMITVIWYLIVFSGMVFSGLAARALAIEADNPEHIFFALSETVLSPLAAGLLVAAVLSAIMSTADSQLLVCASTLSHDLSTSASQRPQPAALRNGRLAVMAVVVLALLVALFLPAPIFSRVLFAWSALGAALGPILFSRLLHWRITPSQHGWGVWLGFLLTVCLSLLPNSPGDIAERLLPFAVHLLFLAHVRRR